MNWKEVYTKVFLQQANKSTNDAAIQEHIHRWWQNTRNKTSGGLRLTDEGYRFITEELDLKTYTIPFSKDTVLTVNSIIWLDNFIDCPYYLGRNEITVTNEKKAVELSLFSGDVRRYGITKAVSKRESSKD